jgi:cytochrome c peroxidase
MLEDTRDLYGAFNQSFPDKAIKQEFLTLYEKAMEFVAKQPFQYSLFDHFSFIQKYVNPLYRLNQQMIKEYRIRSYSFNDYSLNNNATSIFDKSLFTGQNSKGVFIGISDADALAELRETGRLLFYDPILSVNNKRSCASCHKPDMFFADTGRATHPTLDGLTSLKRNTPSLVNAIFNHLIMLDGKHINLEAQCRAVITNPDEMGGNEDEIVKKVMSCDEYKTVFKKYLKATPHYKSVNLEHIASAIILYYSDFSSYYSSFDRAMNEMKPVDGNVQKGFNLFMSKAQCATCHFVPVFNGTKPPYTGSEFEVIGVPADTAFASLSPDKGRHLVNPASETLNAFRTGTVRNATFTKPYMHNGVFNTLDEVINFYAAGGGAGRGLRVSNQTLSSDSLQLSEGEKKDLIAFIQSLTEEIPLQKPPAHLPQSRIKLLNARVVGGEY